MKYDFHKTCQMPAETLASFYDKYFNKTDGTFVEVGAFDGVSFGFTWPLAKLGWRGLCIEPHPDFAARCASNHEGHNVTVETCAAGREEGAIALYVSETEGGALSSTKWTPGSLMYGALAEDRKITVAVRTLDSILSQHQIQPGFELLTIDVEEAELDVLFGFSVGTWQPKMVIIETHETEPNSARNWKAKPIGQYFSAAGYQKIYADHINSVFVR